ncbi:MAG: DUF779 domain-containing protein [Actinomycetota bacterium]
MDDSTATHANGNTTGNGDSADGAATDQPTVARVVATAEAQSLIDEIREDHPSILFHQSGGCCDGSSPMCYPTDDFRIGMRDVKLGEIDDVPVYISGPQFETWRHTQLILDVVPGRGGMFSLDNGRERRFLVRSRVFTEEELAVLDSETN